MKRVFKSALLLATGLTIALSSCKKADEATPVESLSSGTIKGQLLYDNNEANDRDSDGFTISENVDTDVPSGAIIRYTYEDVITGETVVGTTKVDASGNYSFSVPTNEDGVDVDITADDFEGSLTFEYVNGNGSTVEGTESGYFNGNSNVGSETVLPGETIFISKKLLGSFVSTANPSNY